MGNESPSKPPGKIRQKGKFMTNKSQEVVAFVRRYVAEKGTGCPLFMLRAHGFSSAEVEKAGPRSEDNPDGESAIQSVRGRSGGAFPFGEVPESVTGAPSLKHDLAALLEAALTGNLDRSVAVEKLAAYQAELTRRQAIVAHARECRAAKNAPAGE